jgi:nitroimidazol reductase NimA-like FMN-containing flavoprotein (pyridoxamine 5'-phosphate oxidase superfamily)
MKVPNKRTITMDKRTTKAKIISLLRSHGFGVLATYGGEYPYASLVSLHVCTDARRILFPTMRRTRKYANILYDARVSVLFDNRDSATDRENSYALTVMGKAREAEKNLLPMLRRRFLSRHPGLSDFLAQPQTSLVTITPVRIVLVRKFQDVQYFDWA